MSIPGEDVIINALNHDIRRELLKLLNNQSMSFSNLLDHFDLSAGKLNYHLKLLAGFIEKGEDGLYKNTDLGNRSIKLLSDFKDSLSLQHQSLIKKAYESQNKEQKSFLHIRYVWGLYFKIFLLLFAVGFTIFSAIQFARSGVDLTFYIPVYILTGVIAVVAIFWIIKQLRPAREFAEKMDGILDQNKKNH